MPIIQASHGTRLLSTRYGNCRRTDYSGVTRKSKPGKEMWLSGLDSAGVLVCARSELESVHPACRKKSGWLASEFGKWLRLLLPDTQGGREEVAVQNRNRQAVQWTGEEDTDTAEEEPGQRDGDRGAMEERGNEPLRFECTPTLTERAGRREPPLHDQGNR